GRAIGDPACDPRQAAIADQADTQTDPRRPGVSKRTGRYGDPPHPKPASTPGARPGSPSPAPAFGERKGAPLPLLTQPMVAVEAREITEVRESKPTIVDNPATTTKFDPSLLLGSKLSGPEAGQLGSMTRGLEAAVTQGKLDTTALVHGKPTVMISPQS